MDQGGVERVTSDRTGESMSIRQERDLLLCQWKPYKTSCYPNGCTKVLAAFSSGVPSKKAWLGFKVYSPALLPTISRPPVVLGAATQGVVIRHRYDNRSPNLATNINLQIQVAELNNTNSMKST